MEDPPTSEAEPESWHPLARVGFRLLVPYFFLLAFIPGSAWGSLIPSIGEALGLEVLYLPNGSGDTTYNYLEALLELGLSVIVCLLWSLLDRERCAYPRIAEWTQVLVRYYLASAMCSYGIMKVFLNQFSEPSLSTLLQRYGYASPMGLAWTFTGFSPAYQFIAGALELSAGLLLCFRRTTTAGALLMIVVVSNVALLNYCFDVPVKLWSTHLLAGAIGLAALDARRLLDLFIFNRPTQAVELRPHFEGRKQHIAGRVLKVLLLAFLLVPVIIQSIQSYAIYGPGAPRSPLYGIYEVVEMREEGELRPGLISDDTRWRYLIFDAPTQLGVQLMDDSFERYGLELERETGAMTLSVAQGDRYDRFLINPPEPLDPLEFEWTLVEEGEGVLSLAGELEGRAIEVRAQAVDLDAFLLTNRGFNWINEVPFNR